MQIAICGSMAFYSEMENIGRQLNKIGHEAYVPLLRMEVQKRGRDRKMSISAWIEQNGGIDAFPQNHPIWNEKGDAIDDHFSKIARSEAVLFEILPIPDEPNNWLIFYFSADYHSGKLKTTEEGEFVWLAAEEIKKQKLFPSLRPVIEYILNPADGTIFATMAYAEPGEIDAKTLVINRCV